MTWRRAAACATVLVFAGVVAACGSGSESDETATPVTVFNVSADPSADMGPATGHRVVLTAAQLRSTLDSLLVNHAVLVAELMHQVGAGNDDPAAAIAGLDANTRSLTRAIDVVYGADGARAFTQLWEQHTQFFVDYAYADRKHDDRAKESVEHDLLDYQNDFASFVTTATSGGASLSVVVKLLHQHVEDLTAYIDADTSGNPSEAHRLLTDAVAHMHVIADAVSDAIIRQHLTTVR